MRRSTVLPACGLVVLALLVASAGATRELQQMRTSEDRRGPAGPGVVVGRMIRDILKGLRDGRNGLGRGDDDGSGDPGITPKIELEVVPELTIGPGLDLTPLAFGPSVSASTTGLDLGLTSSAGVETTNAPTASTSTSTTVTAPTTETTVSASGGPPAAAPAAGFKNAVAAKP